MIIIFVALVATTNNPNALNKAAEAYSRYEHFDENLDRYYQKTFTVDQRAKLNAVAMIAHAAIERKITVCITFP